jgi:hypothetical protein
MQIAAIHLDKGSQKECKNLLEEGKTTLDGMTDVDPTVHASFYWISSQYHKSLQEFADFYKNALLYLAYTTVGSLSEAFKLVSFAVNNNTSCTKSAILFYFQNVPWMLVLLIVDTYWPSTGLGIRSLSCSVAGGQHLQLWGIVGSPYCKYCLPFLSN